MLSAVYSFEVKRERKEEILEAWAFITRDFIRSRGSLGSRMHRDKEGRFVAIALWPDRASWEAKPMDPSPELKAARDTMMKACELLRTDRELDLVMDLWVTSPAA